MYETKFMMYLIVYTGARARFLYWQCLQLVLRKQIAALIRVWELPSEFEVWVFLERLTSNLMITCRSYAVIYGRCIFGLCRILSRLSL
jgi:hypothetical protein